MLYVNLTSGPTSFNLGWWDSFSAVLVGTLIGSLGPAILVPLGAKTGLRCMTLARYAFGLYTGGVIAFFNALTCIGWSMVNTMVCTPFKPFKVCDAHALGWL
jgi:purine-cytosine permease-like protein